MIANCISRDNFGMYADSDSGPGPGLMGANKVRGNDVYNKNDDGLGDIQKFMIDLASGKITYAVLSFGDLRPLRGRCRPGRTCVFQFGSMRLGRCPPYAAAQNPSYFSGQAYCLMHAAASAYDPPPPCGGHQRSKHSRKVGISQGFSSTPSIPKSDSCNRMPLTDV